MSERFEDLQNGAGDDIWGIDAELEVSVGYDSFVNEASLQQPAWVDDDWKPLPAAERVRLADMMIERWTRYRAAVLGASDETAG